MTNLQVVTVNNTPNGISPKKYALSKGIALASNEILLFTDADCLPESDNWVEIMASQHTETTDIVLGLSPLSVSNNLLGWVISFETFITSIRYLSLAQIGFPYMGVGRNLSYKKSTFESNNGFKTHEKTLSGDDDLFIQEVATKTNTTISIDPKSVTKSPAPKTLFSWLRQKKRHLSTGKKYNFKISLVLGLEILSLFCLYLSFLCLAIFNYEIQSIMVAIILRTLLLFTTFTVLSIRFQQRNLWIVALPLLEFVYLLYIIIVSFLAVSSKRFNWE